MRLSPEQLATALASPEASTVVAARFGCAPITIQRARLRAGQRRKRLPVYDATAPIATSAFSAYERRMVEQALRSDA